MKHDLSVVGIDIAKHVFHLVGMDDRGTIILRKRLMRGEVMAFMAKLPRVTVGMEACGGSHYWARRSAMWVCSRMGATLLLGWVWYPSSTPRGDRRGC